MLYHLLPGLEDVSTVFNLFNYITVRSAGALATGLLLALILGKPFIRALHARGIHDVPRMGPQKVATQASAPDAGSASDPPQAGDPAQASDPAQPGVPQPKANMGGLLIVFVSVSCTLLWAELANPYTLAALIVMTWMGGLGFLDDYLKVVRGTPRGLVERYKWIGSVVLCLGLGLFLVLCPLAPVGTAGATATNLPFVDDHHLVFAVWAYLAWVVVVLTGATHSVNLTDGIDGLAPGLVAIATITFGVFAYLIGRVDTSAYLGLIYLPGAGELAVFAAAVTGTVLGFLWFNAKPAQVIMGDTGSLALGGCLGAMAVLLKAELLLALVGGVFVMEAGSSLLQRQYYRYTRRRYGTPRRVFKCAPVHHHFQMLGWKDEQVVVRFWILGILCALVGFATLKVR